MGKHTPTLDVKNIRFDSLPAILIFGTSSDAQQTTSLAVNAQDPSDLVVYFSDGGSKEVFIISLLEEQSSHQFNVTISHMLTFHLYCKTTMCHAVRHLDLSLTVII